MSYKERNTITVNDLLELYIGDDDDRLLDINIINVLDTAGNVVDRADELEVIYELEWEDD